MKARLGKTGALSANANRKVCKKKRPVRHRQLELPCGCCCAHFLLQPLTTLMQEMPLKAGQIA
jgi:hypothetical protein